MLLGDSAVGKTCVLVRFKDGAFLGGNFIATVGIDFRVSKNRSKTVFHQKHALGKHTSLVFINFLSWCSCVLEEISSILIVLHLFFIVIHGSLPKQNRLLESAQYVHQLSNKCIE